MRLLLVEDEMSLATGLVDVLTVKGYDVDHVTRGDEGLTRALEGGHALLLLDVMLPGLSGFDVLRRLRAAGQKTPVIMLTARGTEVDRVLGFELGVDDYVTKPFSLLELLGRIAAVLRRVLQDETAPEPSGSSRPDSHRLTFGDVVVDLDRYTVTRAGTGVPLPARAQGILKTLASRQGQVVPRDILIDEVWGVDEYINVRTLNNLVVKIRQVIERDPDRPRYLKTVHGVGYRLDLDGGDGAATSEADA